MPLKASAISFAVDFSTSIAWTFAPFVLKSSTIGLDIDSGLTAICTSYYILSMILKTFLRKLITHEMRIRKQRASDARSGVTSRTKDDDKLLRHSVPCES